MEMIRLEVPEEPPIRRATIQIFRMFCQHCLNRLFVGQLRYGEGTRQQKFHERLKKETSAYFDSGNAEHLLNIANYCVLEWITPSHPKHHFDNTVDSATR